MARLEDLHEAGRKNVMALECPQFEDRPFATAAPAQQRKLAIVSTAALIARGETPFKGAEATYRVLPDSLADEDILPSHISVNFDRSAAIRNIETIFPRKLCKELAQGQLINEVSDEHYSFMGSVDPLLMEESANQLAARMQEKGVNCALLLPV